MKEEKDMDFVENLRKSGVLSKVYWNERYCYISKCRWCAQYLEKSASHWLLFETWRWNWMIKAFTGAEIWFVALWLETIQISGSTGFTQNSHINVLSKQVLKKVNAFSTCLVFVRVATNHRHVICKKNHCLYLHDTLFRMHVEKLQQRKNLLL